MPPNLTYEERVNEARTELEVFDGNPYECAVVALQAADLPDLLQALEQRDERIEKLTEGLCGLLRAAPTRGYLASFTAKKLARKCPTVAHRGVVESILQDPRGEDGSEQMGD